MVASESQEQGCEVSSAEIKVIVLVPYKLACSYCGVLFLRHNTAEAITDTAFKEPRTKKRKHAGDM